MYKKIHFVQHPKIKRRHLSVISEEKENLVIYDYIKSPKAYKTSSKQQNEGNYDRVLVGYLEIK